MKNLASKKLRLIALADAFETLHKSDKSFASEEPGYWDQRDTEARFISFILDSIERGTVKLKRSTSATLKKHAADALKIRDLVTNQEGIEFWQEMHQFTAALADEITDLIPRVHRKRITSQAVY